MYKLPANNGFALPVDRATLLYDRSFAQPLIDHVGRVVKGGKNGFALRQRCVALSIDSAALSIVSSALSTGNKYADLCNSVNSAAVHRYIL